MSKSTRSGTSIFAYLFAIFLAIAVVVYLLRGFRILTGIPGWMILVPILLCAIAGIMYGIEKTTRF